MDVLDAWRRWPDRDAAIAHLEHVLWQGKPVCPYCDSEKTCPHASKDHKSARWQCQKCGRAFSPTVGTIFHGSNLTLEKWFVALALLIEPKGQSLADIAREIEVPYKTAWSIKHRVQQALQAGGERADLLHRIVTR